MATAHLGSESFAFSAPDVVRALRHVRPKPIRDYYVVVAGRRFPPKQVVAELTGLPSTSFGSEHARSLVRSTGFPVHRRGEESPSAEGPYGGAEAALLASYAGRWIAQDELHVLFDAASPDDVVSWLRRSGRRARVWRVPSAPSDVGSATVTAC